MRIAGQPRRRGCPHLLAHERPVIVCGVGCVEQEKFHDVLRIFLGLKDVNLGDASLLPRVRKQFGDVPAQICFEWNTPQHTTDDAVPPKR